MLLYRRGFLKSPTAVLRFASPSLFKPLNGALEFTPDQLAGVGKHITGMPVLSWLCMRVLLANHAAAGCLPVACIYIARAGTHSG